MKPPEPPHETLELPTGPVRVAFRRSRRARRVSLRIDPLAGVVVVTLPMRAARRAGLALLMGHADWVAERLAELPGAVMFADGAELRIDGIRHRIRHCPQARCPVRLAGETLEVSGEAAFLARRVRDFLRSEARRRLGARVVATAAQAGLAARRITVRDTRSRWGSCSADRSLSFSWRLIMAPDYVQDYVVAHEVAHLRHMDHGPQFWRLVGELTTQQDRAKDWLRVHGPGLLRIG